MEAAKVDAAVLVDAAGPVALEEPEVLAASADVAEASAAARADDPVADKALGSTRHQGLGMEPVFPADPTTVHLRPNSLI